MKMELIGSLLHEPEVLFLDEPTIGLDVVSQKKIRKFLLDYNQKNDTTIILTSHYMDDVQDLCDRLIIINEGRLGYDGSIQKLIDSYGAEKFLKLRFYEKVKKSDLAKVGRVITHEPYKANISIPTAKVKKIMGQLATKYPLEDMTMKEVTLEEVVSDIFSGKKK
ncbi:AAA family ATPase [Patescibacteria group bacterium]